MAKAAAIVGPTLVGRLGQTFYGYTKAVPKSTVATWMRNLLTCADQKQTRKRRQDSRSVPDDVKARVLKKVEVDEARYEETTTTYVADLFRAEGQEVSQKFVRTFLHDQHKSLRTQPARRMSSAMIR